MSLGAPIYQAIEIAFRATGQQAVRDLDAGLQQAKADLAAYQAQLQAGAPITRDAIDDLARYTAQVRQAEEALEAVTRVSQGLPAAGLGGQAAARGFLEFSRAVEDFAVAGPLGALNNMPGIFQNIAQSINLSRGAVAGWTAAISLAATAAFELYKNWDKIRDAVGLGAIKTQAEEMEELRKKTSLTADEAERLYRATALQEGAASARKAQSKAERDQASAVKEAFVELGPTGSVARGILSAAPALVDAQGDAVKAKEALEKFRAYAASEGSLGEPTVKAEIIRLEEVLKEARFKTAEEIAQTAAQPDLHPGGLAQLRKIVAAKPSAFGPGAARFAEDLMVADPVEAAKMAQQASADNMRMAEAEGDRLGRKHARERAAKEAKAAGIEDRQRVGDVVSRVGPGEDDRLERDLYHALKGGAQPGVAVGAQIPDLIPRLEKRGVPPDIIDAVADKIFEKALARAENLISEGGRPKLDVRAEVEGARAGRAETAREKAEAAAFGKLRGVGKGEGERVLAGNLARDFQERTSFNDVTSMAAGRGMAESMKQGLTQEQAFVREISKLAAIIRRQNGELEAANAAFGQAAEQMGQISAQSSLAGSMAGFNGMNGGRAQFRAPTMLNRGSN